MTQIYPHPQIEDHFVEYDFVEVQKSPPDGSFADLRRRLMEDYVGEKCILLRNIAIDYDRDFIRGVDFPQTWSFKKFASRVVETPADVGDDPAKQELARDIFGGDNGAYRKFEEEVRRVNGGMRAAIDEVLRHHKVTKRDIVWRHTETRVENLHFDIDKDAGQFEPVRFYYNMDDVPRIWHTTHGLSTLLAHYYDELHLETLADAPLERLLHVLSVRLFGNWQSRGREQFPRHMALFEPGDLWIVDGRTVPHQVIYGRRVAARSIGWIRRGSRPGTSRCPGSWRTSTPRMRRAGPRTGPRATTCAAIIIRSRAKARRRRPAARRSASRPNGPTSMTRACARRWSGCKPVESHGDHGLGGLRRRRVSAIRLDHAEKERRHPAMRSPYVRILFQMSRIVPRGGPTPAASP